MPKYEFAIACRDELEAHRKKEGDIVAVRPYPWNWGRKEIDAYLIVIIECNKTIDEMKKLFQQRLYEGGLIYGEDFRAFGAEDGTGIDYSVYPPKEYAWDIKNSKIISFPTKIAKNRFSISLSKFTNIDLAKIQDKKKIYQPFKKAAQLVSKFDGLNGNHLLNVQDVDCAGIGIDSETEISIKWKKNDSLIKSNFDNTDVNP